MYDPNLVVSDNATVFLGAEHDPQPDLCLRLSEDGQTDVNVDGYLVGPPEMTVEIAGSSASYDFGEKRDAVPLRFSDTLTERFNRTGGR